MCIYTSKCRLVFTYTTTFTNINLPYFYQVMPKVYPNAIVTRHLADKPKHFPVKASNSICYSNNNNSTSCVVNENPGGGVLTVWKKSLLFNCDGYTVFDGKGNLVFRVDNYCAATKSEIVLMDASGNSLLTIRRKRLSMSDNWLIYKGETTVNPILSVKKHAILLKTRSLAHATSVTNGTNSSSSSKVAAKTNNTTTVTYDIEGSYTRRCCTIYDGNKKVVAEIKQKEVASRGVIFGLDVFRLIVQPEMDSAIAMALVILLDQMFGSSKRLHFT